MISNDTVLSFNALAYSVSQLIDNISEVTETVRNIIQVTNGRKLAKLSASLLSPVLEMWIMHHVRGIRVFYMPITMREIGV